MARAALVLAAAITVVPVAHAALSHSATPARPQAQQASPQTAPVTTLVAPAAAKVLATASRAAAPKRAEGLDGWSGYAVTSTQPFTSVHSRYVQPSMTCPVAGAFTLTWIGLDGFKSDTVEQDGTAAYCSGSTPMYVAWWEMYPTTTITQAFSVRPGDTIDASVSYAAGVYTMTVKDLSSGASFTKRSRCAAGTTCLRSSAEWVMERPAYGAGRYAPLAQWTTATMGQDMASVAGHAAQPISAFPSTSINMVDSHKTHSLATVGPLSAGGTSFDDTWRNYR